ncbi:DUF3040 domain-containing protein [Streptomyces griseoluteus]|uniref:DUF3040 domain-containing protein n=1 Tax=Streptomyces griseoluteus TaxID=29306 RepID=UPI00341206E9
MKGVRLSAYDKRVPADRERALGRDPAFARRLREMRAPLALPAGRRSRGLAAAVIALAVVSLILLAVGVACAHPVLVRGLAATSLLTLAGLIRLTPRWSRGVRATPPAAQ